MSLDSRYTLWHSEELLVRSGSGVMTLTNLTAFPEGARVKVRMFSVPQNCPSRTW